MSPKLLTRSGLAKMAISVITSSDCTIHADVKGRFTFNDPDSNWVYTNEGEYGAVVKLARRSYSFFFGARFGQIILVGITLIKN